MFNWRFLVIELEPTSKNMLQLSHMWVNWISGKVKVYKISSKSQSNQCSIASSNHINDRTQNIIVRNFECRIANTKTELAFEVNGSHHHHKNTHRVYDNPNSQCDEDFHRNVTLVLFCIICMNVNWYHNP